MSRGRDPKRQLVANRDSSLVVFKFEICYNCKEFKRQWIVNKMKVNENLRNTIFEVIDNQINANDPAGTAITLKRLMKEGYSEFEAKQLIGQVLAVELFDVMKKKIPSKESAKRTC
jgi:thioredoxin-related protein